MDLVSELVEEELGLGRRASESDPSAPDSDPSVVPASVRTVSGLDLLVRQGHLLIEQSGTNQLPRCRSARFRQRSRAKREPKRTFASTWTERPRLQWVAVLYDERSSCCVNPASCHFSAAFRATPAFLRARTAQWMIRRMAFAYVRALIADLRAEPAERLGPLRGSADPLGGKKTDVCAIAAKPDATCHQIIVAVMIHADHIVRACLAELSARETGSDAVLVLLR